MQNQEKMKFFQNLILGSRDMAIFKEPASQKMPKFDINAHNF